MTVDFVRTLPDIDALVRYQLMHSRAMRRSFVILQVAAPLLMFAVWLLGPRRHVAPRFPLVETAFSVVWILVVPRWLTWSAVRRTRRVYSEGKVDSVLGPVSLELAPDALVERSGAGEVRTRWSAIDRVDDHAGYIFIMTSAVAGYAIPRSAFPSADDGERFLAKAKALVGETRPIQRP